MSLEAGVKFTVREMLSLAIGLGGFTLMGIGISDALDTGTCGSGGAHAIARACPQGSGLMGLLIVGGFVLWFAGLFVSTEGLVKPGAGLIIWSVGFAGGGFAVLFKAITQSDLGADSQLAGYIMAAVFIPLGLGVWVPSLQRLRKGRAASPAPPSPAPPRPVDHPEWQKQLHQLRSRGALTRAEFDELKVGPDGRLELIHQLAELKASGILTAEEFEAKKRAVMHGAAAG